MSKMHNKLSVLTKIREEKNILFGQFSDKLTKPDKVNAWNQITDFAKSLGLVPIEKDYTYTRDVFWSNIKRATLSKKDNAKQTGSAGGKGKTLNAIDNMVLDIIGKDSPIVEGLGLDDQYDQMPGPSREVHPTPRVLSMEAASPNESGEEKKKKKTILTRRQREEEDLQKMRKRKLELQLEYLFLTNKKLKLEITEIERRLQVSPSRLTPLEQLNDDSPSSNSFNVSSVQMRRSQERFSSSMGNIPERERHISTSDEINSSS